MKLLLRIQLCVINLKFENPPVSDILFGLDKNLISRRFWTVYIKTKTPHPPRPGRLSGVMVDTQLSRSGRGGCGVWGFDNHDGLMKLILEIKMLMVKFEKKKLKNLFCVDDWLDVGGAGFEIDDNMIETLHAGTT